MSVTAAVVTAPRVLLVDGCEACAGRTTVLRGQARAGEGALRYVEVSLDAGITWDEASLTGPNLPGVWVEWEHPWTPPNPGVQEVRLRVTDAAGTVREGVTAHLHVD